MYRIDSRQVSLEEYRYAGVVSGIVGWITKLLRLPIPSSTDDPPVETLRPWEVAPESLPAAVWELFRPEAEVLQRLGFESPVCHAIVLPHLMTQIYWATYAHDSGTITARLHARYWNATTPPMRGRFTTYFTEFSDGEVLVTSAGKPDMLSPPAWQMERVIGADPTQLFKRHCERLENQPRRDIVILQGPDDVREQGERLQAQTRDFHVQRGVFRPITTGGVAVPSAALSAAASAPSVGPIEVIVHEMQRQQQRGTSWWGGVLTLLVSLALFVGTGFFGRSLAFTAMLVPVLLFHESGHWLAMKVFGYRNTKMFFIPFFGAAVTGRHYNVAGWKKTVVSLMGPVPGIALGCVLGVTGLMTGSSPLQAFALVMITLNAFNLLPILPLDGGWVLHTILFSRHPLLDVAFRVIAILGLAGFSIVSGDRILFYIAIPMAISVRPAYKIGKITRVLRRANLPPAPSDAAVVPDDLARVIAESVQSAMPANPPALSATYGLQVYEALNARPPGWLASLGLLFVHGGAFFVALVMALVLVVAKSGHLREFVERAANQPKRAFDPAQVQRWKGAQADGVDDARVTLIGHFRKPAEARGEFDRLSVQNLPQARACLFGNSILLTLPTDQRQESDRILAQWKPRAEQASLAQRVPPMATVMSIARKSEIAQARQRELEEYFAAARVTARAIPPWSPDWQPNGEHAAAANARRTLVAANRLTRPPTIDAKTIQELKGEGNEFDAKKVLELTERFRNAHTERRRQHYQALRQADPSYDQQILDWLEATLDDGRAELANTLTDVKRLLGSCDLDSPHLLGTRHGNVERAGLLIHLQDLEFVSPPDGLPAVAAWLHAAGDVGLKYDIFHKQEWEDDARDEESAPPMTPGEINEGRAAKTDAN